MHLIIDGYGRNVEILKSEEFIYRLLDQYPAEIGMTKISSPLVVKYTGDDWGISGIVLIAESHVNIHTFVERCYVNIDVFSCKDFDTEQAIKDLSERLQLTEIITQTIDRDGQRFSRPSGKDRITSSRL
jgi:S-adenosylmethionine decarboxylase